MALVFVWMVVLDKSTVSVSAPGTYTLEVTGDGVKGVKKVACSTDPCLLSVPSGTYTLIAHRDGYAPAQTVVVTTRGETTSVVLAFSIIPAVTEVGTLDAADPMVTNALSATNLSRLFPIDIDPTHGKQRLRFQDESTKKWSIWAYFDRTLEGAKVFPHPDLKQAIVSGKGGDGTDLYLIDGAKLERTFVAHVPPMDGLWWSPDTSWVLIHLSSESYALLDVMSGVVREWPFTFSPDKVTWSHNGRLIFATTGRVSSLVNQESASALEIAKAILDGSLATPTAAFELGEYNVDEDRYRALDSIAPDKGMDYATIHLGADPASGRVFFTDGTNVFEVIF